VHRGQRGGEAQQGGDEDAEDLADVARNEEADEGLRVSEGRRSEKRGGVREMDEEEQAGVILQLTCMEL
jgi:hypothetical protein